MIKDSNGPRGFVGLGYLFAGSYVTLNYETDSIYTFDFSLNGWAELGQFQGLNAKGAVVSTEFLPTFQQCHGTFLI